MSAILTAEQQELRSAAARFLDEKSSSEAVRSLIETDTGFDEATWKQMAELGWMGMAIPEEYGGIGYTFAELGVLLEEMGKRLLPAPFFSSAVLGAQAILNSGDEDQKKKLLPLIADGSARATLAFVEADGRWDGDPQTKVAGSRVEGTKSYVLDGHTATHFVVSADQGLFIVDGDDENVVRKPMETLDGTRKQARIEFSGANAVPLDGGKEALQKTLDQGAVALAAEMVGTAQQALDMAVDYAKTRIQFGRPIGSFQGIKHLCAKMLTDLEMARSAAAYGAWAVTQEEQELPIAACIAKAWCSDAVFEIAAGNIQVHGGIGFTWEHDAHLYLRRAKSQEIYLGDASYHRAMLAERLGI